MRILSYAFLVSVLAIGCSPDSNRSRRGSGSGGGGGSVGGQGFAAGSCVPGSSFQTPGGCADCICPDTGKRADAMCTLLACDEEGTPTAGSESSTANNDNENNGDDGNDGEGAAPCNPGEVFETPDGCASCVCPESGVRNEAACRLLDCVVDDGNGPATPDVITPQAQALCDAVCGADEACGFDNDCAEECPQSLSGMLPYFDNSFSAGMTACAQTADCDAIEEAAGDEDSPSIGAHCIQSLPCMDPERTELRNEAVMNAILAYQQRCGGHGSTAGHSGSSGSSSGAVPIDPEEDPGDDDGASDERGDEPEDQGTNNPVEACEGRVEGDHCVMVIGDGEPLEGVCALASNVLMCRVGGMEEPPRRDEDDVNDGLGMLFGCVRDDAFADVVECFEETAACPGEGAMGDCHPFLAMFDDIGDAQSTVEVSEEGASPDAAPEPEEAEEAPEPEEAEEAPEPESE